MAQVKVRFSKKFHEDLTEIEERYSEKSAEKRIKAIFQRVEDLKQFPLRGRPVPELQDKNIRQIEVLKEFRLIYHVVDEAFLDILRVFPYLKNFNPDEDLIFD